MDFKFYVMDIRYHFLNTLDHFPCELIRTLWKLQSLDMSLDQMDDNEQDEIAVHMETQAEFLQNLVQDRINTLMLQREELLQMQRIRKRYDATRNKGPSKNMPPLTIRLNLKNSNKAHKRPHSSSIKSKRSISKKKENTQDKKYCICQNVSYGSMIACDNPNCPIEWFHYGCVGIVKPLKGEWFCSEKCKNESKIYKI